MLENRRRPALVTSHATTRRAVLLGCGATMAGGGGTARGAGVARELGQPVPTITPAELDLAMRRRQPLLILDVREPIEFAVGHVPGARRQDHASSFEALALHFAEPARGTTVVCYCTIGIVSVAFAERFEDAVRGSHVELVASLAGGILAWHDLGLPLVDARGPTPFVHPGNAGMADRMARPHLARLEPRP